MARRWLERLHPRDRRGRFKRKGASSSGRGTGPKRSRIRRAGTVTAGAVLGGNAGAIIGIPGGPIGITAGAIGGTYYGVQAARSRNQRLSLAPGTYLDTHTGKIIRR